MSPRRRVGLVVAIALVVRAIYWIEIANAEFFRYPLIDAEFYDGWAKLVAGIASFDGSIVDQSPLFPWTLGLVYRLFGPSVNAMVGVHFLLGAATAAMISGLAARAFGARIGLVAGVLAAIYPPFFFNEATLMPTAMSVSLTAVVLTMAARLFERLSLFHAAGLGVAAGLAFLCRSESIVLAFTLAAIFAVRERFRLPKLMPLFALALAGAAPFLAAYGLYYRSVTGDFRILPSSGGLNLYVGNNPEARGTGHPPSTLSNGRESVVEAARRFAEREAGRPLTTEEVNAALQAKAVRFALEEPLRFAALLWRKVALFLHGNEVSDILPYDFMDRESVLKRLLSLVADFAVIGPLALIGIALALRGAGNGAVTSVFFGGIAAQCAVVLLIYVISRFRLPAAVSFLAFAGLGLDALASWLRDPRTRLRGVAIALAAIVLGVLLNVPNSATETDEGQAFVNLGSLRVRLGDWPGASRAFAEAERAAPDSPVPLRAHALRLLGAEKLDEAESVLDRLLAAFPRDVHGWIGLGSIRSARGDVAGALVAFRRAEEIDPLDPVAPSNTAAVLSSAGRFDEAIEPARRAMKLAPGEPRVLNELAWALLNATDSAAPPRDARLSEATRLAETAATLSNRRDSGILDTLEKAYLATGRTAEARQVAAELRVLGE